MFNTNAKSILDASTRALTTNVNFFRPENVGYYSVIDNGVYYNPAWKHYGHPTNVYCDRCNRQNLPICLGYSEFDLCMSCAFALTWNNEVSTTMQLR